jgi:hypothetical protein
MKLPNAFLADSVPDANDAKASLNPFANFVVKS